MGYKNPSHQGGLSKSLGQSIMANPKVDGERFGSLCSCQDQYWQDYSIKCEHVSKVLFMGIKINFAKELDLEFGSYIEIYDGTLHYPALRIILVTTAYVLGSS